MNICDDENERELSGNKTLDFVSWTSFFFFFLNVNVVWAEGYTTSLYYMYKSIQAERERKKIKVCLSLKN